MTTPQHIQEIDDVQMLKEKILKIDTIFTLVSEKQRKITEYELKCKKIQQDCNKLVSKNNTLNNALEKSEKICSEYEVKLLEESQKYSLLEETVNKLKVNNKKTIKRFKKHLVKQKQQYCQASKKKYSGQIFFLRKTIKYLRSRLKHNDLQKEKNAVFDEKKIAKKKEPVHILQNILVNPTEKKEELINCDIDSILHEMTFLPDLMDVYEEVRSKDAQTQTTRSTVTRPVQTDSLSRAKKLTQTYWPSSIEIQCNLSTNKTETITQNNQLKSKSIQTECDFTDNTPPKNVEQKTTSSQTIGLTMERKLTVKQAVAILKQSRKTFTISNGLLINYSKNPVARTSSNEAVLVKNIYRRLTKYIDTKYSDSKQRHKPKRKLKRFDRSRCLMRMFRKGLGSMSAATSDTESSGYESRMRCVEDLGENPATPSGDSGILSEVEGSISNNVCDINGIFDEMLVDVPSVLSPLENGLLDVTDDENTTKDNSKSEVLVEIEQKEKTRKRPVNRMAMLKKNIKKCNQIRVTRSSVKEDKVEVVLPQNSRKALGRTKIQSVSDPVKVTVTASQHNLTNKTKDVADFEINCNKLNIVNSEDHLYALNYNLESSVLSKKCKSPITGNYKESVQMINDCFTTQVDICPEFETLCSLDVAENVIIAQESSNIEVDTSHGCTDIEKPNITKAVDDFETETESPSLKININEIKTRSGRTYKTPVKYATVKSKTSSPKGSKVDVDTTPMKNLTSDPLPKNIILNTPKLPEILTELQGVCDESPKDVCKKRKRGRPRKDQSLQKQSKQEQGSIPNVNDLATCCSTDEFDGEDSSNQSKEMVEQCVTRKRPGNRLTALKRNIKKCSKINIPINTTCEENNELIDDSIGSAEFKETDAKTTPDECSWSSFSASLQCESLKSATLQLNKLNVDAEFRKRKQCIALKQKPEKCSDDITIQTSTDVKNYNEMDLDVAKPNEKDVVDVPKISENLSEPTEQKEMFSDILSLCKVNFYTTTPTEVLGDSTANEIQTFTAESVGCLDVQTKIVHNMVELQRNPEDSAFDGNMGILKPDKNGAIVTNAAVNIVRTENDKLTTRSGRSYESPSIQKPVHLQNSISDDNECHKVQSCNSNITIEHQNQNNKGSVLQRPISLITKATFKQVKAALDKCVWLRGDKRACQEEVEKLKKINICDLVSYIIQYFNYDRGEVEKQNGSMDPLLTCKQKVVFGLMIRIQRELENNTYIFQLVCGLENHLLYNRHCQPEVNENLSRFYTALCRFQQQKERVRVFISDLLYISPPDKFAIIYTILTSWLNVLPPYKPIDTGVGLQHVLAHITFSQPNIPVASTSSVSINHDTCIGVLKTLFITFYKFPKDSLWATMDDLCMGLLESYMCGGQVEFEAAILILCSHASLQWTYGKIQLMAQLCKVSKDEEVLNNLFKLIVNIAKKLNEDYKQKVHTLLNEVFNYINTTNQSMHIENLHVLCQKVYNS